MDTKSCISYQVLFGAKIISRYKPAKPVPAHDKLVPAGTKLNQLEINQTFSLGDEHTTN